MNKQLVEASVGIFVLAGLICVAYLTVKLGRMEVLGGDYYAVTARFDSISGLKKGAVVEIAGVPVGTVDTISLETKGSLAVVKMKIRADVKIDMDVMASVKTSGLIGDKYIRLEPGGSDVVLDDGSEIDISNTESAVDLEKLISEYAFGSV